MPRTRDLTSRGRTGDASRSGTHHLRMGGPGTSDPVQTGSGARLVLYPPEWVAVASGLY